MCVCVGWGGVCVGWCVCVCVVGWGGLHVLIKECHMERPPIDHNQEFYATAASTEFFEWVFCSLLVCLGGRVYGVECVGRGVWGWWGGGCMC